MISSKPRVSFVIINWNGLNDTIECLNSLRQISYPNYEIIIVDNDSKGDDVKTLREKFGNYIRLIQNEKNLGFAGGNNVGINLVLTEGNSKYIMFLNNDTVVKPDFLDRLVARAESDLRCGIVGPEIHLYHQREIIHSRGGILSLYTGWRFIGGTFHPTRFKDDGKYTLKYFSGSAFMASCRALKEVGYFDEEYFYYAEDVDLGYRLFKAGYRILCEPGSKIYHKEGASVGGNVRNPLTVYYDTRNSIMFIRKHGRFYHRLIFIPWFVFIMFVNLLFYFPKEIKVFHHRLKGLAWHLTHRVSKTPIYSKFIPR
ncbi:MAG: glycosyltransferase family 2 protein [Patescibacteria group bacterium]|nr:glycosyltransferase family 2 protein [Patescibacteria group bacterium]